MTRAFLYKWTEHSTGMWYIGSRSAKKCHVNDGYICSSKTVKPLILEKPDNWTREILCFGDPLYIVDLEAKYLTMVNAKYDSQSYNCHNGDGKFNMTGRMGGRVGKVPWNKGLTKDTDSRIKSMAGIHSGATPWNKGLTKNTDGRIKPTSGGYKEGHVPWNSGLQGQTGVTWTHTAKTKELLSEQKKGSKNPAYGKTPWNKGVKTGKSWYTNGIESKLFGVGEVLPGFIKGRKMSQSHQRPKTLGENAC